LEDVPQTAQPRDLSELPSSLETTVCRILDIEASTFQHLLDALKEILGDFRVQSISLLAPSLHRRAEMELIASTLDAFPARVWRYEEENTSVAFFPVYCSKDATLFASIRAEKAISGTGVIARAIRTKFHEAVAIKKQLIRRTVIEQSIKSKDVNSFLVRLVRAVRSEFVFAQEISIFLHDEKFKTLSLAATSCPIHGIEKKDIYYQLTESTPTVIAFLQNAPLVREARLNSTREEFDENISCSNLDIRGFWPLSLAWSEFSTLQGKEIAPIGTIRLSDHTRRSAKRSWSAHFSEYDHIIVAFMAEVIFVLVQQYQQFRSAETDFARLTHGLGANIEASLKFASNIKDMLFVERDDAHYDSSSRYMPAFSMIGQTSKTNAGDVYLGFKDLEFFLDDLHYQFTRIHDAGRYERETIERVHSEVLMPAINLAPAIAAVNSKEPPKISNLRARGSFDIKPISGNRKGLILVFRNLIENSIKYAKKGKVAEIDFKFSDDDRNVVIDYFDKGIGILDHEVGQIFVEGFRSLAARRTNNRGIGIGLSSSREVMRALDGDLTCIPENGGAHFRILLRKAT
jgi:hypothetical protein